MVGRMVESRRRRKPWDSIVYDPDLDWSMSEPGTDLPGTTRFAARETIFTSPPSSRCAPTPANRCGTIKPRRVTTGITTRPNPSCSLTLTIDGQQRRVLMQANKNGFFYVLDREKGSLISATPFTEINWATGIDSNGRPIENAGDPGDERRHHREAFHRGRAQLEPHLVQSNDRACVPQRVG